MSRVLVALLAGLDVLLVRAALRTRAPMVVLVSSHVVLLIFATVRDAPPFRNNAP